jgi:hypothetical protein
MKTRKTRLHGILRTTGALLLAATLAVPAVAGPPEGRGGGNGGGNGSGSASSQGGGHGGPAEGQTGREFGMERAAAGGDNRSPRAWETIASSRQDQEPEPDAGEDETPFEGGTVLPDGTVEHELPTFISDLLTSE